MAGETGNGACAEPMYGALAAVRREVRLDRSVEEAFAIESGDEAITRTSSGLRLDNQNCASVRRPY